MARLSREEVEAILKPFHPRILGVIRRGWGEWRAVAALRAENGIPTPLYSRTITNDVFDAIARYAIGEFRADPSVNVKTEAQTIKLFFKGIVGGRFKRGDEDNLGQNVPTNAALALEYADGELPGFPPQTAWVEFIWQANELNTRLEYILVVARDGDRMLWSYELEDEAGAGGGVVTPFATPPATPLSPEGDGLITPKKSKVKKPLKNNE